MLCVSWHPLTLTFKVVHEWNVFSPIRVEISTPNQIFTLNEFHPSRWDFTLKNPKNIERIFQALHGTRTMLTVHRRIPPQWHVSRHSYSQNIPYNLYQTVVHISSRKYSKTSILWTVLGLFKIVHINRAVGGCQCKKMHPHFISSFSLNYSS
jgi:hypothetical protein